MLENLKVDIIYYQIDKDFEMEFNLCGCCRMRLLNSIADNIKSLISNLKLAVARSKVVLICGNINCENNLFTIISKAIGRETEEIENSVYGINSNIPIRLMKDSIPLISKDGVLCGCVVEEGPQSIIILSEDKDLRKEIMQSLVHQYIYELNKAQPFDEFITQEDVSSLDEEQTSSEQTSDQTVPLCEDNSQENTVEKNEEILVEKSENVHHLTFDNEISSDNDPTDLILDFKNEESEEKNISDIPFVYSKNDFVQRKKSSRHSKHSKVSATSPVLAILICLLLCFVGILLYFLILKPLYSGISISDNLFRLIPFLSRRCF